MTSRNHILVRRAWIACVVLGAATVVPSVAGWDMMDGGYAWIIIAGFGALTAGVTALVLRSRVRWDRDLENGGAEDLIAQWTVPDQLWRSVTGRQADQHTVSGRGLLAVVWFWCVVIGIGFVIADPEDGWAVAAAMGVLMAVTGVASVVFPRRRRRRLAQAPRRVAVARTRVLLGDEWHSWSGPGSRLQSVRLVSRDGAQWLDLHYSYLTRVGPMTERVLLPVPVEATADAQRAVDALNTA